MKNYQHFKLEDFVLDPDFRKSVLAPGITSEHNWKTFLDSNPDKKQLVEKARKIILSLEPAEDEISEYRLNSIWQRINRDRKRGIFNIYHQMIKYAAVFVLAFLLGAGGLFILKQSANNYSETYTEINVPYGEKSEVTLYDGTKVSLNSGTKLRFPLVFNSGNRKVFVEGEAFFDVAKDKNHPFIVNAGPMSVEVLGTRFNVCAYPDDDEISATLEEGKISANMGNGYRKTELKPGQQLIFSLKSKTMELKEVNTDLYTSWKNKLLRFENASFPEVIKKMERWYDVKISVGDLNSFSKKYNMTIKTESLREILQLLSLTTPIKYEINENKVFITR